MNSVRLAVIALLGLAFPLVAEPTIGADQLSWMAGHWRGSVSANGHMEEHWTDAAGGALVGLHKDVQGGKMTSFEFLRIDRLPDGTLAYLASPQGQAITTFRVKELSDRRVVFENPEHDFPQRVLYWRTPEGHLAARIEGTINGKAESMQWEWTRAGE
jgi:uncharacterized protein YfiM (DUF2279 family)